MMVCVGDLDADGGGSSDTVSDPVRAARRVEVDVCASGRTGSFE